MINDTLVSQTEVETERETDLACPIPLNYFILLFSFSDDLCIYIYTHI